MDCVSDTGFNIFIQTKKNFLLMFLLMLKFYFVKNKKHSINV